MAPRPPPTPSSPATAAAAAHPSISPRGNKDVPTTIRALWAHARAGDALPEGRPGLGRADRFRPGSGEELAAHGLRFSDPLRVPRRRTGLAIGAGDDHALGGRNRQARPGPGDRAR